MNLEEIKKIKRQIGVVYALMIGGLLITTMLACFISWSYLILLAVPQILAIALFSPTKIMDMIDSCWAVYRVNKDMF